MGHARQQVQRRRVRGHASRIDHDPARTLAAVARDRATVVLLGLEEVDEGCWAVLDAAQVELVRMATVDGAVRALTDRAAQVVIADARHGLPLTAAIRRRHDLASVHIVLCAALD
jgi:hypothetical protein